MITPIKCQWLKNSSRARPLITFLKTSNDSMFAKLSGRSFQSWAALYEKDRWPVADLKDGIYVHIFFIGLHVLLIKVVGINFFLQNHWKNGKNCTTTIFEGRAATWGFCVLPRRSSSKERLLVVHCFCCLFISPLLFFQPILWAILRATWCFICPRSNLVLYSPLCPTLVRRYRDFIGWVYSIQEKTCQLSFSSQIRQLWPLYAAKLKQFLTNYGNQVHCAATFTE